MTFCMCPGCYKGFSGIKALSGGWLGAKKVYGCPHCRTFFTKIPIELLGLVLGFLNVLFVGPYVFIHRISQGEYGTSLAGILFLFLGAMLIRNNLYIFRKSVRDQERIHTG